MGDRHSQLSCLGLAAVLVCALLLDAGAVSLPSAGGLEAASLALGLRAPGRGLGTLGCRSGGLHTRPTAFPLWASGWKLSMAFNKRALRSVWGIARPHSILARTFFVQQPVLGLHVVGIHAPCLLNQQGVGLAGGQWARGALPPPSIPRASGVLEHQGGHIGVLRYPALAAACMLPAAAGLLSTSTCCHAFLASPPPGFLSVLPPSTPLSSSWVASCPTGRSLEPWGCKLAWGTWPACRLPCLIWAPLAIRQRLVAAASRSKPPGAASTEPPLPGRADDTGGQ